MPRTPSNMQSWRTHEYGAPLDVLRLDIVEVPTPQAGEVRVKVHAIPLNLNDLERINGGNMMVRPELPYAPGMEVMGVVDACGEGAESYTGKRVVGTTKGAHGGYSEYAICPTSGVFEIPDTIPLPDAAALFFPFHLAWLGLVDRADLQPGESVLIHAGAGGSGSAAIQIAKHLGASVFATAGTDEKVELCRDLGADVAINYTDENFSDVVLAHTSDFGVDVVFDNVGESVFEGSLRATKYNGRYLMMGFASNKVVADEAFIVPRRIIMSNIKLCGVLLGYANDDMRSFLKTAMGWNMPSVELGAEIMQNITTLYEQGIVKAVVGRTAMFDEIPHAIHAMANRNTTGRTIVLLQPTA